MAGISLAQRISLPRRVVFRIILLTFGSQLSTFNQSAMKRVLAYLFLLSICLAPAGCSGAAGTARWSEAKAARWEARTPWLRGCNYTPSNAINQLEMWQEETFSPELIDKELGWAEELGFNCMRVFLHHLVWEQDRDGFVCRMDRYLEIASSHGIRTMFVFLDDCWDAHAALGPQREPRKGVHNSGWLKDPGALYFGDPADPDCRVDTAAILGTLGPIFTMIFAFLFLKEPITGMKAGGVALSFGGILYLILHSVHDVGASATSPSGIVLMLLNSLCFALYLALFRPVIAKYNVVTFMKWMFLFSLLMCLPFAARGLLTTDYAAITPKVGLEIGYLVFFATFVAYFLIPYGQKRIRPTLVSMYSYLQPVLATALSIILGVDALTWQKILATALVVGGVVLVSKSRAL